MLTLKSMIDKVLGGRVASHREAQGQEKRIAFGAVYNLIIIIYYLRIFVNSECNIYYR